VEGQLQRSKKPVTLRGLNRDHNHDLKDIFKGAAMRKPCGNIGYSRVTLGESLSNYWLVEDGELPIQDVTHTETPVVYGTTQDKHHLPRGIGLRFLLLRMASMR
jgi:hypothetical protein